MASPGVFDAELVLIPAEMGLISAYFGLFMLQLRIGPYQGLSRLIRAYPGLKPAWTSQGALTFGFAHREQA